MVEAIRRFLNSIRTHSPKIADHLRKHIHRSRSTYTFTDSGWELDNPKVEFKLHEPTREDVEDFAEFIRLRWLYKSFKSSACARDRAAYEAKNLSTYRDRIKQEATGDDRGPEHYESER